jgi:hypothetical protein
VVADLFRMRNRPRSVVLVGVQIVLTLLTGWLALQIYSVGGGKIWRLFAGLAVCSYVSVVFRAGWLVPCVVLGTIVGMLLDPAVKGGDADSQIWETVQHVVSGTFLGLVAGLLADSAPRREASNASKQNGARI